MLNLKTLLPFLFIACVYNAFSQEAPEAILGSGDVDKFLKTYKPLVADLETLGDEYSSSLSATSPAAVMSTAFTVNAEVEAILKKHGWDSDYFQKFSAIMMGYAYVNMEKEMNYDDIPEDQKPMVKQMLDQAAQQFKHAVNDKDINLVRTKYSALKSLLDSL